MEGWIKLHRKLLNWEWYDDMKTKSFFLHCLLKANFETKRWHGFTIPSGAFITSLSKLNEETGLTTAEIRTCVGKLTESGEIEKVPLKHKQFTLIKVCNYGTYQNLDLENNNASTKSQQKNDKRESIKKHKSEKRTTTTKKEKNNKNSILKEEIEIMHDFSKENEVIDAIINFFDSDILQNLNENDQKKWLAEIQSLNLNDGYSYEDITNVIIWARSHEFWSGNLLTLDGISKKYGGVSKFQKILKQYKSKMNNNGKNIKHNEAEQYQKLATDIYQDTRLH
jgi:hypothetical protein